MAATGTAPIHISLDAAAVTGGTDDLLTAILHVNPRVSDVIFSPGRKLQVQISGEFAGAEFSNLPALNADDTRRIASNLIGNNKAAIGMLREQGYCDVSYALPGVARFRVNVFIQRGSCAVVMRVIPTIVPTIESLNAPAALAEIARLREGLVLVTGPRGSGKSSTLAALIDRINSSVPCHIITIEDPIEFLHNHKQAILHQRELHSDTPSLPHAMRAALRQAPHVIAVGELKERESMELALEAAEAGHLVLSTMTAPTAAKAVDRIVSILAGNDQSAVRDRLARILRCVISQRLVPRRNEGERTAVFEIVNATVPELGLQAEEVPPALQHTGKISFDSELERLVHEDVITTDTALAYASDAQILSAKLSSLRNPHKR